MNIFNIFLYVNKLRVLLATVLCAAIIEFMGVQNFYAHYSEIACFLSLKKKLTLISTSTGHVNKELIVLLHSTAISEYIYKKTCFFLST